MPALTPEFGTPDPRSAAIPRSAAYAVVRGSRDHFLIVRAKRGLFLPGGGSWPGESPEVTVCREVLEEIGADIVLDRHLGRAIQHFAANGVHYRMTAEFFAGTVPRVLDTVGEHEALWIQAKELEGCLYHECHEWAVRRA